MKKRMNLQGIWRGEADGLGTFHVRLPGTLDSNGIGSADEENLESRLTRRHVYEGEVRYSRVLSLPEAKGKRLFLKIERTKELNIEINGHRKQAFEEGTLSTPWLFEVTEYAGRKIELALLVDNSYRNWPRESMIGASAVTDETQTNWNGIVGEFAIYEENQIFFKSLRVYPASNTLKICADISRGPEEQENCDLCMRIKSEALKEAEERIPCENGQEAVAADRLLLKKGCKKWDEEEGNLYTVYAELWDEKANRCLSKTSAEFGIRTFSVDAGFRFTLNKRRFFLRGEANCCIFPETGYPPMTEDEWIRILKIYASYGVNCMRFHSWCPPEAAFAAADRLGMMMQPELSQWNYKDAFGSENAREYYKKELFAILKAYANHPSFVMLTFGNELQYTKEGDLFAEKLLKQAKAYDPTRLYANASNYHYGEKGTDSGSDFYTAMAYYKEMLRATSSPMIGHLNQEYPSASHSYDDVVQKIHQDGKAMFEFEVGQYEVLPDFSEIEMFQGVTKAVNLEIMKERVEKAGLLPEWNRYVEATGELANLCYREEVEAALRTGGISGLSLLGLQDFPGQGTALVGMLNSHLAPKPYAFARPERFRAFFAPTVPLICLERYTYWGGETLQAQCRLAHYGKEDFICEALWELVSNGERICSGSFQGKKYEAGGLLDIGKLSIPLPKTETARKYELRLCADGYENTYPIWTYPKEEVKIPKEVTVAKQLTDTLIKEIENGKTVFLEPEPTKENFPTSVGSRFTTDFWSVGTFPEQEGTMGMLIENRHPVFSEFPTEFFCGYQWWQMAQGRTMLLPGHIRPIVTVPDSYGRLRHMGLLFEASLGRGQIIVSSMGLLGKQQYPECRGLLRSIVKYLGEKKRKGGEAGMAEKCRTHITKEELQQLVAPAIEMKI